MHFNAARLTAQEFECFVTNGNDLTIVAIERHNGGLVHKNSFAGLIDECVDCAQIYSELISEKLFDKLHGDGSSSKLAGPTVRVIAFRAATRMPERQSVCVLGDVFGMIKDRLTRCFQKAYDICAVRRRFV
jgi:hypothetical protein